MPKTLGMGLEPAARPARRRLDSPALGGRRIRAAAVELLVAVQQIRPLAAQPVEEDVADGAVEEEGVAADGYCSRLGRQLDYPLDLLRRVVDAGHQRRDEDAGRYPLMVELGHGLEAGPRVRCVRFRRTPGLLVERRHRQARADVGHRGDLLEQVDVAQEQRGLGEDRTRVAGIPQRAPDAAHELVAAFDPLIRIGVGPERDVLAPPRRTRELCAQDFGRVDLDDDPALEVAPRSEAQELVRRTGEAVHAGVRAAAIRVHRPVERDAGVLRHPVERRLRAHLHERDVQRLRCPEAAHGGGFHIAGQRALRRLVDLLVRPPHERMFARPVDGRKRRCVSRRGPAGSPRRRASGWSRR